MCKITSKAARTDSSSLLTLPLASAAWVAQLVSLDQPVQVQQAVRLALPQVELEVLLANQRLEDSAQAAARAAASLASLSHNSNRTPSLLRNLHLHSVEANHSSSRLAHLVGLVRLLRPAKPSLLRSDRSQHSGLEQALRPALVVLQAAAQARLAVQDPQVASHSVVLPVRDLVFCFRGRGRLMCLHLQTSLLLLRFLEVAQELLLRLPLGNRIARRLADNSSSSSSNSRNKTAVPSRSGQATTIMRQPASPLVRLVEAEEDSLVVATNNKISNQEDRLAASALVLPTTTSRVSQELLEALEAFPLARLPTITHLVVLAVLLVVVSSSNSLVRQVVLLAVVRSAPVSLATRLGRQVRLVAASLAVNLSNSSSSLNSSNKVAGSLEEVLLVAVRLVAVSLVAVEELLVNNHSSSKALSHSSLEVCSRSDRTSLLKLVLHPASVVVVVVCLAVGLLNPVARLVVAAASSAVSLLSKTLVEQVRSLVAVVLLAAAYLASLRLPARKLQLVEAFSALAAKAAPWADPPSNLS